MGCLAGLGWFILLVAVVNIEAQNKPPIKIHSKCLGNLLRVDLSRLGGSFFEVSAVINNSSIILTPSLSSQCGFTIKKYHLGNAVIYASVQNCFAQNVDDKAFTTKLGLRLQSDNVVEDEFYLVSVKKAAPNDYNLPAYPDADPRKAAEQPMDAGFKITTVVFFTPEERVMQVDEAQRNGYGISSTPTRLVAGVPMTVLNTSIIFEKTKLTTQLYAGAACPQAQGGVFFTETSIRWFLPRHIDPLIYSKHFRLLEVNMGVDGRKLEATELSARNYSLTLDDLYVIVEIPIGAAGCQIKSHAQDGQYFTSYMNELMLELLWTEDDTNEDTRYKVFLPVETPLQLQPPQVIDATVPKEMMFKALIGPVGQRKEMGVTIYNLHLTFGFLVLPKHAPFTATAYLRAKLEDIGLYPRGIPPSAAPPSAASPSAVELSSIKSRLDVTLRYPKTNTTIQDFSLACNFVTKLIECFPNGTITAIAITLENPACGPTYSNDQYAYFVFTANSCGTTRKFLPNMMLYENEISITDELELRKLSQSKEPEFELKVFCYYDINTNQAIGFNTRPRRSEPYADDARGEMQVEMRVALDDSYSAFHRVEDDPITKYLQQPLYFEVELMGSYNPKVSLELAHCWVTLEEDKMSLPQWDLIVNGCANSRDPHPVIFHSVLSKGRVHYPSNFKRFEVPMFAFAEDKDNLNRQVFVHCEVVICDVRNPVDAACNVQCSDQDNTMKGQKRAISDDPGFKHVTSGPIIIMSS
ncbi:hypothetical protein KUCAC02_020348 [Chaenocephalus aceratus]|uniref:Uncharacterized protein n=1 Tax=Chaenocephalus aceratus TaxID=36190 RepID=A0ACB9VRS3_CHAAC|nr:hypothetical protein KUCAC02_020348 [Chaenocephalus aceratus]